MALAPYQKASCPMCRADVPHATHLTALELAQAGITIELVETPEAVAYLETETPPDRADEGLYETPEGDWEPVPETDPHDVRRETLVNALARAGGHVATVVQDLGWSRATVYRLMKMYGLSVQQPHPPRLSRAA